MRLMKGNITKEKRPAERVADVRHRSETNKAHWSDGMKAFTPRLQDPCCNSSNTAGILLMNFFFSHRLQVFFEVLFYDPEVSMQHHSEGVVINTLDFIFIFFCPRSSTRQSLMLLWPSAT